MFAEACNPPRNRGVISPCGFAYWERFHQLGSLSQELSISPTTHKEAEEAGDVQGKKECDGHQVLPTPRGILLKHHRSLINLRSLSRNCLRQVFVVLIVSLDIPHYALLHLHAMVLMIKYELPFLQSLRFDQNGVQSTFVPTRIEDVLCWRCDFNPWWFMLGVVRYWGGRGGGC